MVRPFSVTVRSKTRVNSSAARTSRSMSNLCGEQLAGACGRSAASAPIAPGRARTASRRPRRWATTVSCVTFSSSARRRRAPSKLRDTVSWLAGPVRMVRPIRRASPTAAARLGDGGLEPQAGARSGQVEGVGQGGGDGARLRPAPMPVRRTACSKVSPRRIWTGMASGAVRPAGAPAAAKARASSEATCWAVSSGTSSRLGGLIDATGKQGHRQRGRGGQAGAARSASAGGVDRTEPSVPEK